MTNLPSRPNALPRNFPVIPGGYSDALFRLQIETARRYLFETELKEVLEQAQVPLEILEPESSEVALDVYQIACFMQQLRVITGDVKAAAYGRDAFDNCTSLITRSGNVSPLLRAVSSADKLFLRIRDAMNGLNRQVGTNVLVKWHGGAESDLFEDTGQHCYGYHHDAPICQTLTGFLEQSIVYLSGVRVTLVETECMASGALTCRWHCVLA
jgi:hypothetical protein